MGLLNGICPLKASNHPHHFRREKATGMVRVKPRWVPVPKEKAKGNSHLHPKAKAKARARQKERRAREHPKANH